MEKPKQSLKDIKEREKKVIEKLREKGFVVPDNKQNVPKDNKQNDPLDNYTTDQST